MIRTEEAYQHALKRLNEDIQIIDDQRTHFEKLGLTEEQLPKPYDHRLLFTNK